MPKREASRSSGDAVYVVAVADARRALTYRRKLSTVFCLAAIGGFVDAIGYLTLYHLFTAHMSGNTVAFGTAVGTGHWAEALRRGVPVAVFVFGVMVGTLINIRAGRAGLRPSLVAPLAVEGAALFAYVGLVASDLTGRSILAGGTTTGNYYLAASLLVFAMGLQNATLRKVGTETVRTTYVTGILTDFAISAAHWFIARRSDKHRTSERERGMALLAGLWFIYTGGGVSGALAHVHFAIWAPVIPAAVIVALALLELAIPSNTAQDQSSQAQGA
ncbi:MAG: YoaK family protein [Acidimicrobiales bacterium]